jgi:type IV secretory pathway VirB10-like protein
MTMKKPQPPKATTLNKGVIIVLTFAFGALMALSVSSIFKKTSKKKTPPASLQVDGSADYSNSLLLRSLPSNYDDREKMDKLLANNTNKPDPMTLQLAQQISRLQQKVQLLESRKSSTNTSTKMVNNKARKVLALKSQIFSPGGFPPHLSHPSTHNTKNTHPANNNNFEPSDFQKQNMQDEKFKFVEDKNSEKIYSPYEMQKPKSPYELQQGTIVPAILQTKIISNLPGQALARIRNNVYDSVSGQNVLIPQGTLLVGQYNSKVSYGQQQVQVIFTRMIRPDGTSIQLEKEQGMDIEGGTGLQDNINNHWGQLIGSAVLTTLFNVPAVIADNNNTGSYYNDSGNLVTASTSGASIAAQSIGNSMTQVGTQVIQRSMNIAPTITINSGKIFNIMVKKDMIIPPYKSKES